MIFMTHQKANIPPPTEMIYVISKVSLELIKYCSSEQCFYLHFTQLTSELNPFNQLPHHK